MLNDIASEMIFPLMPAFLITVLGGNRFQLGIMEGVADSLSSLLRLWSGAWSDRLGWRKGFVVVGYALAALSRPLAGAATLPWDLLAVRAVDRIGKGIRTSPRDALIATPHLRQYGAGPLASARPWTIWVPPPALCLPRCFSWPGRAACVNCSS
jgi:hypothetical protein